MRSSSAAQAEGRLGYVWSRDKGNGPLVKTCSQLALGACG